MIQKQMGKFYFENGKCLVKPDCPECLCGCPSQGRHKKHKGPTFDTGLGHKECESCGCVTEVYAPI